MPWFPLAPFVVAALHRVRGDGLEGRFGFVPGQDRDHRPGFAAALGQHLPARSLGRIGPARDAMFSAVPDMMLQIEARYAAVRAERPS